MRFTMLLDGISPWSLATQAKHLPKNINSIKVTGIKCIAKKKWKDMYSLRSTKMNVIEKKLFHKDEF